MPYHAYIVDTLAINGKVLVDLGNYSLNVEPMYDSALKTRKLESLDGMRGSEVECILRPAVKHLTDPAHQEVYKAMNPMNGWGDLQGAQSFITRIWGECRKRPNDLLVLKKEF